MFPGQYDEAERLNIINYIIDKIETNDEINALVSAALKKEDSTIDDDKILKLVIERFNKDDFIKNTSKITTMAIAHKDAAGNYQGTELTNKISGFINGKRNRQRIALEITDEQYFRDNDQLALKKALNKIKEAIPHLEECTKTIKNILQKPDFIITSKVSSQFPKKFPVAFITADRDNLSEVGNEYRADRLEVGKDTSKIGVPEEHINEVASFLESYNLQGKVEICDLKLLKQTLSSTSSDTVGTVTPSNAKPVVNQFAAVIHSI